MKKFSLSVLGLALAVSSFALTSGANTAEACEATEWDPCNIPNTNYDGGDRDIDGVPATACLPKNIRKDITKPGGDYDYVVAIVNPNGSHQKVKTIRNKPCWSQDEIEAGTYMAVYVTCRVYNGWIAFEVPKGGGEGVMSKQPWKGKPKWMKGKPHLRNV